MASRVNIKSVLPVACLALLLLMSILMYISSNWDRNQPMTSIGGVQKRSEIISPLTVPRNHNWFWLDVFSYVPNAIELCTDLFPDSKELPPAFAKKFDEYTSSLTFKVTEGYSASYREEFLVYIKSVQAPFVRTVCETGFNAGHSTFTWLAANPRTHVYSFDIGQHSYSRPAAAIIAAQFPGRFNITWGDSTKTLPVFHENNPDVKCDLIIIDGGHTYDACKSDFDVFKKMANSDNILILDNYPDKRLNWISTLGKVWEQGKQNGEIAEIFSCHYTKQGFSVGRIITCANNLLN